MYHTAVSQSQQLETVPLCSKASKQVSLQESCLSGSQTQNTQIHSLSRTRVLSSLFRTYEEALLCYFVCLVISSSLPSRSDVSYSRNLTGTHGTYNSWGPHFLWQDTWSHPTRLCEERHGSIYRVFTLVLTLSLQKYNGMPSVSTQGIEGRVCAHATWPSHVRVRLVAAQLVGPEW